MVAVESKAFAQIQAMGVVASVAGIKVNRIAPVLARVLDEPVEQLPCVAASLFRRQRHEIVYIKNRAPREKLREAKSSRALHSSLMPERQDSETLRLLAANP